MRERVTGHFSECCYAACCLGMVSWQLGLDQTATASWVCCVVQDAQDMYLEQQRELTLTKKIVVIQKTVLVLVTYSTSFASGKGSAVSNKYKDCFLVLVHLSSVSHPNNTTTLLPTLCHGARYKPSLRVVPIVKWKVSATKENGCNHTHKRIWRYIYDWRVTCAISKLVVAWV